MKIHLIIMMLVIAAVILSAGCTGSQGTSGPSGDNDDRKSDDYQERLSYSATNPVTHYRSDGSCYWVSDVDVRNDGDEDADNVMVRCNLVDTATNTVSDTKSRYFEVINAGDHAAFTVELDGNCGSNYNLEVIISRDER